METRPAEGAPFPCFQFPSRLSPTLPARLIHWQSRPSSPPVTRTPPPPRHLPPRYLVLKLHPARTSCTSRLGSGPHALRTRPARAVAPECHLGDVTSMIPSQHMDLSAASRSLPLCVDDVICGKSDVRANSFSEVCRPAARSVLASNSAAPSTDAWQYTKSASSTLTFTMSDPAFMTTCSASSSFC